MRSVRLLRRLMPVTDREGHHTPGMTMLFEWLFDVLITIFITVLVLASLVITCAALNPPRGPHT
jgi:hypothetical protein